MSGRSIADPALFGDIDERVLFFTTASCPSCDEARRRLVGERSGVSGDLATAIHAELHAAAGVTGVPLILSRTSDGGVSGRIAGKPAVTPPEKAAGDRRG